jgi:hypothetical protein
MRRRGGDRVAELFVAGPAEPNGPDLAGLFVLQGAVWARSVGVALAAVIAVLCSTGSPAPVPPSLEKG